MSRRTLWCSAALAPWALFGCALLLGCKGQNTGDAEGNQPATITAALGARTPAAPVLEGQYRVDAFVAINDKAKREIGNVERLSVETWLKNSMEGGAFVFGRWAFTFAGEKLTVRMDSAFRFQDGFQWGWCEAEGTAIWAGQVMTLPAGVATKAQNGFVSKDQKMSGNCSTNVAAGSYTVKKENGETRLYTSREDVDMAFVLVKDDSVPDVEEQARKLAGYTQD